MYLAEKFTSVWPSLLHLALLFLQITLCRSFIWEGSARGPAPSIYHYERKGTPFVYIILTLNDTLSHT